MTSPTSPTSPTSRERLVELLRERSFERKRVILASGRESDFFIDCKQAVLTAEGHALVGALMFEALDGLPPCEAVAGVELGGCPLASADSLVSFLRGRPLPALYVRKEVKDHGSRKLVEGDRALRPGLRVVILEDVITTGGSTLKAIEKLRAVGAEVVGVIALVDRLEGGVEALQASARAGGHAGGPSASGLPVVAICSRRDFLPDSE